MKHKLHKDILPKYSFDLLQRLTANESLKDFYLVGGTALSLYLGHRESVDLDFFSQTEFPSSLAQSVKETSEVTSLHNNSIELVIDKTKVFFFYFAFPRYKDLVIVENIVMADPIDIGLMKLLALQGRSTKKDIIDLYFIDKDVIALEALLEIFQSYFPKEKFNSYDSIKTLLNPEFLKAQPTPRIIKTVEWEECFDLVSRKVMGFLKDELAK